jgi:hypothetical protein
MSYWGRLHIFQSLQTIDVRIRGSLLRSEHEVLSCRVVEAFVMTLTSHEYGRLNSGGYGQLVNQLTRLGTTVRRRNGYWNRKAGQPQNE